jgi:hypothetical protein
MPVGKPLETRPICSTKHSWEDITKTDFKEIIMKRMNLLELAQNIIQ